jgi:hypothetical protein
MWLKDDGGADIKGSVDIQDRDGGIEIIGLSHGINLPVDSVNGKITDGFNSAWAKARAAAEAKHPELRSDFTFHDIKAKGISDLEGTLQEKQNISGHKSLSQTVRYDRKVKIVPVVGNQ